MKKKKALPFFTAVIFICIIWEIIAHIVSKPDIFPSIFYLLQNTFSLFTQKDFYLALLSTLVRGLTGFSISLFSAFLLAILANKYSFWQAFLQPFLVIIRSVPVISFVLLAILWLNSEQLAVFIALVTMFPILFQNIETAFSQINNKWIEMAKVYGKSARERFFTIYLPASKQQIYAGISTAMGFGWRAIIIGEALAQPLRGIGTGMKQAQSYINVPMLMAWTIVAIIVSYLFDILIKKLAGIKKHLLIDTNVQSDFSFSVHEINAGNSFVTIQNLNKKYEEQVIFDKFSISFDNEYVNCLRGTSGKGKTTLLRMIAGLENYESGKINIPENYKYAYSFQDTRLLPWLTVYENIKYVERKKTSRIDDMILFLAKEFEISEHLNKYPNELSGGQRQRVELIRALITRSDILLLDEPLTGLDDAIKKKIIRTVSDWISAYHPLVIWATHENIKLENTTSKDIQI